MHSAVGAVSLTVLLSVVPHGASAGPVARHYARHSPIPDQPAIVLRSRKLGHEPDPDDVRA